MIQDYHQYKDSDHHDKWQPVVQEVNCCGNTFRLCDTLCIQRSVIACSVENPAKYSCSKSETESSVLQNTGISKTTVSIPVFFVPYVMVSATIPSAIPPAYTNTAAFQYVADDHHDRTGTAKNSESEESKSHNYHSCFINSCFPNFFINAGVTNITANLCNGNRVGYPAVLSHIIENILTVIYISHCVHDNYEKYYKTCNC